MARQVDQGLDMMNLSKMNLLLLLPLLVTACAEIDSSEPEDDLIDESFSGADGKSDAFGLSENSDEAEGVLDLVNSITGELYLQQETGIGPRAAKAILKFRNGPDGSLGGYDDRRITSLQMLDAIPYVGVTAFGKLLAYAEAEGYVTVNPYRTPCTGTMVTKSELQTLTVNGTRTLGMGGAWQRTRHCNGPLGCGPWSAPTKRTRAYGGTSYYIAPGNNEISFITRIQNDRYTDVSWQFGLTPKDSGSQLRPLSQRFSFWDGVSSRWTGDLVDAKIVFTGHCFQASGRTGSTNPSTGTVTELELVYAQEF